MWAWYMCPKARTHLKPWSAARPPSHNICTNQLSRQRPESIPADLKCRDSFQTGRPHPTPDDTPSSLVTGSDCSVEKVLCCVVGEPSLPTTGTALNTGTGWSEAWGTQGHRWIPHHTYSMARSWRGIEWRC
jgi:hypothetical protein